METFEQEYKALAERVVTAHFGSPTNEVGPARTRTSFRVYDAVGVGELEQVKVTSIREVAGSVEVTFTGVHPYAGDVELSYVAEEATVSSLVLRHLYPSAW